MEHDEVIRRCRAFIQNIGICILEEEIGESTFLPGITVRNGCLVMDRAKLKYPGDLLHEAGHIALIAATERKKISGDVTQGDEGKKGYELGVLLWSYFAAKHVGVAPEVVFHPDGYKGESEWLIGNFRSGKYIGLPLLEWMQIARKKPSGEPEIISWLRQ